MGRRERESKKKRKDRKEKKREAKHEHGLKRVGEWVAGWLAPVVALPGRTLVFIESSGEVAGLFHELEGDPPLDGVGAFRAACEDPFTGLPRRPQRLRTADERLADTLGEVPNLVVTVDATPEITAFEEKLRTGLARSGAGAFSPIDGDDDDAPGGSFGVNDEAFDEQLLILDNMPEEMARGFHRAAAALDDSKLWACVRDGRFLEARVQGYEALGSRFVLPLQGDGEPQAVLVFGSRSDAESYCEDFWGELEAPMAHLSMVYEPVAELSSVGRVKLARYGQSGDAFLVLRHFDEGEEPAQPATEGEVRLSTAILAGLRALFESHGETLASARSESVTVRVETPEYTEHPAVTFTLEPWDGTAADYANAGREEDVEDEAFEDGGLEEDDGDDEDEEDRASARPLAPELEAAMTRLSTAGRNEPCPCGSKKKYKKCHLVSDQNLRRGAAV